MSDKKIDKVKDPYSDEAQMNSRLVSKWYDEIASSVTKCPFCDLKEKFIIKEVDETVLTMNLFPYIDGHLMVIPKRHVEHLEEMNEDEWMASKELIEVGMEVLKQELGYQNFNVLYRQGTRESGSSLKHLHIHILPINESFMDYEQTSFTYKFQKITIAPKELAKRLRSHVK